MSYETAIGTIIEAWRSAVNAACSNPVFGAFISPE
jgi:hypothetical protein